MSPKRHDLEAEASDRQLHRLLFFTDAVFAIVLTLLSLGTAIGRRPDRSSPRLLERI